MLRLNELTLFEEVAGVTWSRAQNRFQPTFCQRHRLLLTGCKVCKSVAELCPQHMEAFRECTECEGPDTPIKWIAAVAWLIEKRSEPALDFDTYAATNGPEEAFATLKNARGGEAATVSPLKRPRGSRRS